jgi:hypothetical protein
MLPLLIAKNGPRRTREAEESEVPRIQPFDIPTILGMTSFKKSDC